MEELSKELWVFLIYFPFVKIGNYFWIEMRFLILHPVQIDNIRKYNILNARL